MRHEIKTLQQRLGITTVHVTHDRQEAMVMADRIVILNAGRIAQIGTPEEIYNRPASPFVASFTGRYVAQVIPGHRSRCVYLDRIARAGSYPCRKRRSASRLSCSACLVTRAFVTR